MLTNVRFAVIGYGEHMRHHLKAAERIGEIDLVAAADPDADQARGAHAAWMRHHPNRGFDIFPDLDTLVSSGLKVDAVFIGSPDRFHTEQLRKAVEAGKHVLCEKPLGATFQDYYDLCAALRIAAEKRLVVTSCHPRRYDPPYVFLETDLPCYVERFGRVVSLELDFSYHRPSKTGLHAGLLADHLNHEVDLMHWLLGHAPARFRKLHDSQLRYAVAGGREDGVTFRFGGTRLLEARRFPESVTVRFERADLRLDCDTGVVMIHDHESGAMEMKQYPPTHHLGRLEGIMANFVSSVVGRDGNYLTHEDLLANTLACAALTAEDEWEYQPGLPNELD